MVSEKVIGLFSGGGGGGEDREADRQTTERGRDRGTQSQRYTRIQRKRINQMRE